VAIPVEGRRKALKDLGNTDMSIATFVYKYRYFVLSLTILGFIGVWYAVALIINDPLLPGPLAVASGYSQIFFNPSISSTFINSLGVTFRDIFAGFALAVAVGIPVGILMGRYQIAEYLIDPNVAIWYSIPAIAFVPLVMNWLGGTATATIVIAFLIAVFSILINVHVGVKNISKSQVDTGRSFGASKLQLYPEIILPASLPSILLGMRLGLTRAIEGVIVAELIFSAIGIGGMIFDTTDKLQMGLTVALIIVLAVISIALNEVMKYINRRAIFWTESYAMTRR
jgi:ABC-type nitrate/sulfonate/bicarbonate transport system permease component